jgi:hypothetical protein
MKTKDKLLKLFQKHQSLKIEEIEKHLKIEQVDISESIGISSPFRILKISMLKV